MSTQKMAAEQKSVQLPAGFTADAGWGVLQAESREEMVMEEMQIVVRETMDRLGCMHEPYNLYAEART
jgi:hypothetical protein